MLLENIKCLFKEKFCEKCSNLEFLFSVFFRIQTECGDLFSSAVEYWYTVVNITCWFFMLTQI